MNEYKCTGGRMIAGGMMLWCQKDCPNEWLPLGLEWFTGDSSHSWNGILSWMACSWTSINGDISPERAGRYVLLLCLSTCRKLGVWVWERGSGGHCHWGMKCKTYLWGFTPCLDPSAHYFTHPHSKIHQQILCTSGNFSSCTGLHRPAQTWTCSSVNFSQLHRPAQHLKLLKTKKQSLLMLSCPEVPLVSTALLPSLFRIEECSPGRHFLYF